MTPRLSTLYLLNVSLLATHEIDSAFWREWELFGLPGGIQLFLALNLVLMVMVLHGFSVVVRGAPRARAYSWLMVAIGIFAAVAHTCFLVQGAPQFRTEMSLAIIYGLLLVSLWQVAALVRTPRDRAVP